MRSLEGAFPPLLFRQGCLLAPSARVIVCYCPKSGVGWAEVSNYAVGGAQILTHAPPPWSESDYGLTMPAEGPDPNFIVTPPSLQVSVSDV